MITTLGMLGRLGFRSRLLMLMLAALLPALGLFTCSTAKNQQAVLALAQTGLQSEALLAAAHQQRLVERAAQLLGDMASSPSLKDPQSRLCVQFLKNLQTQHSVYSSLGVADLRGQLSCPAASLGSESVASGPAFFVQALDQQAFSVGEYAVSQATGRPGLVFGMPVHNTEGALNGIAFASVDLAQFTQLLATEKILEGALLRVIDRNGLVLASQPAGGQAGRRESDPLVLRAARSGQPGVGQGVDASGIEKMYAYAPVASSKGGLFVAISVPRSVLVAAPHSLLMTGLAALLAMAAFGMACARTLGWRVVVKPVNAMLQKANEIAGGNLAARVSLRPSQQDEIGRLGLAFNRLATALQAQRGELDAALHQADVERAMLELILNSMGEGVIAIDAEGRSLRFNRAASELFAAPGKQAVFSPWPLDNPLKTIDGAALPPDEPLRMALRKVLAGASIDQQELVICGSGRQDRRLKVSARPLLDASRRQVGALAVFVDVTDGKAAERFALAQEEVLMLIAGGASARASLEAVVRLIESSAPGSLCAMQMCQDGRLQQAIAPSLPLDFVTATDGSVIAEGMGACGTAAFRRETVVVEDARYDPLIGGFRELLAAHGLLACWSTPVVAADGEMLATFAVYRRSPGRPQPADEALIAAAVRLARLALQRARAEAALVGSQARFHELAENIEDVFYSVDARQCRVHYISPGYEKVWGRSCDSLYAVPASYASAVLPEDRHLLAQASELNAAGQMARAEYRIVSGDGQTRWIRDRSYPVLNAAGQVERVVGTARDITDRKLAEIALAASHRALQMLSASSLAINRIHDEAALLAEVCRVAIELGGYRMAWVGYADHDEEKTIRPVAHAGQELGYLDAVKLSWRDDRPSGRGPAGRAVRSGLAQQADDISQADRKFHGCDAARQRGYFSVLALPLRNQDHSFGVLCLYTGAVQQFTAAEVGLLQELADNLAFGLVSLRVRLAQQRSEQAQRITAARLLEQASLIDLAPGAIVVRNLDLTIRFWSKGAERLYGWPAEQVLGKTMQTQMYRDPDRLAAVMAQIQAAPGDWTGEVEQSASDGSPVYAQMRGTVVRDRSGQVDGMLIVNTDVRERRQAHEEIQRLNASLEERVQQRTAQLKLANEQLEAFSYSVSHDLRTPLSTINGFSNLLEKSITAPGAAPLTERSRHYLARIRAGVGQMGELIDAMLALAQVSRSRLVWERVDLSAKAEALLLDFQEKEPGRAVRLHVEPSLLAEGDPRLLGQVLYNLLANAWKFCSGTDCTCITLGRQLAGGAEPVYFVRDNGAGFDMAYAPKLFGAFQRLHTEAQFGGTGIGLATVQRIIARHNGRVWAESAPGEGATFYFTLGAAAA